MVMDRKDLDLSDEQLQDMVDNGLLRKVGEDKYEMTEYQLTKKGREYAKEQGII